MDNNFYTDDFENLVKEKADEFRMYPSKRVWHSLYNDLHPSRRWPSVTISMVLIMILVTAGYLNTSDTNTPTRKQITKYDISAHSNISEPQVSRRSRTFKNQHSIGNSDDEILNDDVNPGENASGMLAMEPVISGQPNNMVTSADPAAINNNSFGSATGNTAGDNLTGSNFSITADANGFRDYAKAGLAPINRTIYSWSIFHPAPDPSLANDQVSNTRDANKATQAKGNRNGPKVTNFTRAGNFTNIYADVLAAIASGPVKYTASRRPAPASTNAASTNDITVSKTKNKISALAAAKKKSVPVTAAEEVVANDNTTDNSSPVAALTSIDTKKNEQNEKIAVTTVAAATTGMSKEDRSWMEDFAFHNKPARKKWKDQVTMEFHFTPSLTYRFLGSNVKEPSASAFANHDINRASSQKPGLGVEAGFGINYAFAKNVRFKAGLQFNYTKFGINAEGTNHPIITSLLMNDLHTGYTYISARGTGIANSKGSGPALSLHNRTYQVSLPLGLAYKLAGNNKYEWYAAASIQPTYVIGGTAYLLSADLKNYVADNSAIRSWNLNTGFETYINYKISGITLQAGPQLRYQLQSTFGNQFTSSEKLYTIGMRLGIVKGF